MARVVFPQEAVVQYVNDLLQIAGLAIRDGATLTRHASSLMSKPNHGRVMGCLRQYANEREQFGANEVREIVAEMDTFRDPKIVEQKKKIEANREVREEERRERDEAAEKASWEPGGRSFNQARDQMVADAHALIFAAKTIEDSDNQRLAGVLRAYYESKERSYLFARLSDSLKPPSPPEVSPPPAKRRSRRKLHGQGDKVVYLHPSSAAARRLSRSDDPPAAS